MNSQYISLHGFGYTFNNSLLTSVSVLSESCLDYVNSQAYHHTYTIKTTFTHHLELLVQIHFQKTTIPCENQVRRNFNFLTTDTELLKILVTLKQDLDQLSIEKFIEAKYR